MTHKNSSLFLFQTNLTNSEKSVIKQKNSSLFLCQTNLKNSEKSAIKQEKNMVVLALDIITLGRIQTFLGLKKILIIFLKIRNAELANFGHILAKNREFFFEITRPICLNS